MLAKTGFAQVLEILESQGKLKFEFPGLESQGKRAIFQKVLEKSGNF